jgi:two-component system, OmpR family, sensor histidine kinase CiaH
MIFSRVRRRLLITNMLAMTIVIGALGAAVVLLMDNQLMAQEQSTLVSDARRVDPHDVARIAYGNGNFYVTWDGEGRVVMNPNGVPISRLRSQAMAARSAPSGPTQVRLEDGQDVLVYSQPFLEEGVLQAVRSLAPLEDVERVATLAVAAAAAGTLLLILAASWFLAGRALVPIRRALERQQQFTADASHELRTPLSVIDAGVQLLRRHPEQTIGENREVLDSMRNEAGRMGRLVASLLALARADSGQAEISPVEADVDELVRAAARDVEPLAASRQARIQLVGPGGGRALVDPDRFQQLVLILVDNALTHSPAGGTVEVTCSRKDRALVLEVADHGPGIPASEREKVFGRFYRLDSSRSGPGAGLGLSIARWIVTAHGGAISLHDNHPGLRARVTLPPTPPDPGHLYSADPVHQPPGP